MAPDDSRTNASLTSIRPRSLNLNKRVCLFVWKYIYYFFQTTITLHCLVFHYIAAGKGVRKAWHCRREGAAGGQPSPAVHCWEDQVYQGIYCHAQIYHVDNVPLWFLTWLVNCSIIDYVLLQRPQNSIL